MLSLFFPCDRHAGTREDFDYLRWYLLHDFAAVFTEGDEWYLLVHAKCKHLGSDNLCGIYESRPQVCREYSIKSCEYEDDWTYERYFETPEQVEEYADAVLSETESRSIRSPKPPLLQVIA